MSGAQRSYLPARRAQGMTLVEVMIAMVIGLLVVGAAAGIFLSNQRVFKTVEGMGWAQDGMQTSFELMARDLREAGGNPCDATLPVANVITNASSNWWTNWDSPMVGYDDGALAGSKAGTDAVQVLVLEPHLANVTAVQSGSDITVDDATDISAGNTVMVCDNKQLAIFIANSVASNVINHASGFNCGNNSLNALPSPCASSAPAYAYGVNSVIGRLRGVRWYVADNGRGGVSLFRRSESNAAEEMVEGVQDMQIQYLAGASAAGYVDAGDIGVAAPTPSANWSSITAVRVVLTVQGGTNAGTGGAQLQRTVEYVVNLRNRTL